MAGNGNSGRRPVPANVHLLRGNPSKKSIHDLAPTHAGLKAEAPSCPAFLSKDAKAEWRRIVNDLVILGLLAKVDRAELAVYCAAWGDWKHAREKITELGERGYEAPTPSGYKQMSVWMQIANRAEERMRASASNLGLNPAARAKLGANIPLQADLFPNDQAETARRYGL